MFGVINTKPITVVTVGFDRPGKISAVFPLEGMKCARCSFFRACFKDDIDPSCFRRPNAKMRFVCADQFRADGIAAKASGIGHAGFSPISRVTGVGFDNFSFPAQHR